MSFDCVPCTLSKHAASFLLFLDSTGVYWGMYKHLIHIHIYCTSTWAEKTVASTWFLFIFCINLVPYANSTIQNFNSYGGYQVPGPRLQLPCHPAVYSSQNSASALHSWPAASWNTGAVPPFTALLDLTADSHCSHNLLVITLLLGPEEKSSVPVDKCRVRDGIYTAVLQPHLWTYPRHLHCGGTEGLWEESSAFFLRGGVW